MDAANFISPAASKNCTHFLGFFECIDKMKLELFYLDMNSEDSYVVLNIL